MDGQRVNKAPSGKRKIWIAVGVVLAVLIGAYVGLCAWAGSQGIMNHVSVAGLDVSGMSVEQARSALEQALEEQGDKVSVVLSYGAWSGTLTGKDVKADCAAGAQAAWQVGRSNFLTQGFLWLGHQFGMADQIELQLELTDRIETLMDEADREEGSVVSAGYVVDGDKLVVTKGITGAAINREQARTDAAAALKEALAEKFAQPLADHVVREVVLTAKEEAPQELDFEAIHEEVYVEPRNAEVDPETYQATDHVVGVDFDVAQAQAAFDAAGEGETVTIPLTLTQPEETKESLQAKLFRDLLGEGTSEVTGSSNRKYNVKLSAQACDGVVIMPGEEFSYNNTTGSRTADKGYLDAPTYVGGASVDNVGGGICQTSSTIYYAVLHTTLEIVERHNHRYAVGYVPDGMDATVWYGSQDFRFKNNTNYPIKIVTESYDKGGARYLTVKIYGTNEDGRYAVPDNSVFDRVAPTTQYKADESIPRGTTKVDSKQNAYRGRKARTYRYIYDKDGSLLEKEDLGVSTYAMRPTTILYNPLDGDPSTWVNGQPPQPDQPASSNQDGQTGQTGGQEGQTGQSGTGDQTGQVQTGGSEDTSGGQGEQTEPPAQTDGGEAAGEEGTDTGTQPPAEQAA